MAKVIKIALGTLNYSAAAIALRPIPQATDKDFETFFSTWVATLEKHGLLNIFTARPEVDGTFTVCDGNTRLFVIKEAIARGNEKIAAMFADGIDVRVEEKSDLDMLSASIVGNATRRDAKPVTYANGLKKMLVLDPTMTVEKLSTDTGLGVETIKKYLGLLDLPEEVKGLVDSRTIPIQNGLSLQKLKLEDQKNPEILQKAQTLTTAEFAAEVEKAVKQEREDRKAAVTGKAVEFIPVAKMIKGDQIAKLWEDTKYAYEQDSSEFNRIRKELMDEIFQADEKSVATQRAAWEKRVSDADAKKKAREAGREKLKAAEAIAMLINSGIRPEATTVQKVLDLCGNDYDKEESIQILRKFLN